MSKIGSVGSNTKASQIKETLTPKFFRSTFVRNVGILMSGTALAQVLGIIAAPILTRLYDPAVFGLLGLFTAVVAVAIVLSTLSYEMALILPKDDIDAVNILVLIGSIIIATTFLCFVLVAIGGKSVSHVLGTPELDTWLWFMPPVILTMGAYNALTYWCIRRKQFGRLSISRVLKTLGTASVQVAAGVVGFLASGLLIGFLLGQIFALFVLALQVWCGEDTKLIREIRFSRMRSVALQYLDFPKFRAPHELIYAFSESATLSVLMIFFNPLAVGFYVLTQKVLQTPVELVGGSIKQVFYPRANEAYLEGVSELSSLLSKATYSLMALCLLPSLLVILFGPQLFSFVFGNSWFQAGVYAQFLILYVTSSFVRMPAATTVLLLGLQKFQLAFVVLRSITMLGALGIGAYLRSDLVAVGGYSIIGLIFNVGFVTYVNLYLKAKVN